MEKQNFLKQIEAEGIAKKIRTSKKWEPHLIIRLCELAGLEKELMAAGEYYDTIAINAAKKLHVNI